MPEETIILLRIAIEKLQHQMDRLVSDQESEKENRKRITKFSMEEVARVNKSIDEVRHLIESIYEIRLDRLEQESERRRSDVKEKRAQWAVLAGIVIKLVIDFIMRK